MNKPRLSTAVLKSPAFICACLLLLSIAIKCQPVNTGIFPVKNITSGIYSISARHNMPDTVLSGELTPANIYGFEASQKKDTVINSSLLKKSRSQKTAGTVLMGVGVSCVATGLVISSGEIISSLFSSLFSGSSSGGSTGMGLAFTGLIGIVTSIPLLHESEKNKQKVYTVPFTEQSGINTQPVYSKNLTGIKLVIPLGIGK